MVMKKKYTKQERKKIINRYYDMINNPDKYGFPFVYIEENGDARELDDIEKEYLNTIYESFDSGRPYIKPYYNAISNDGKRSGYLLREKLPLDVIVNPSESINSNID